MLSEFGVVVMLYARPFRLAERVRRRIGKRPTMDYADVDGFVRKMRTQWDTWMKRADLCINTTNRHPVQAALLIARYIDCHHIQFQKEIRRNHHEAAEKHLAVLTSGGDAPGMNAAIRSCIRTALEEGCGITGIMRGYSGLLEEDMHELDTRSAGGIVYLGGTVLKTARCPAFLKSEVRQRAADILVRHHIDGLIVIGGDGSMAGAEGLSSLGIPTVTVPGTIDNDMNGTDYTIGYDTAVNTALDAVRKIRDTASSHDRAALVEVMGRKAGHLALSTGIACGAEYVLVPEIPF